MRYIIVIALAFILLLTGCQSETMFTYEGEVVKVERVPEQDRQVVWFYGDSQGYYFYHATPIEIGRCYTIISWKSFTRERNYKTNVRSMECPER